MGYLEGVMGDSEREVYRTHRHVIVLLQQAIGSLFAFVVFLGLGLAVLLPRGGEQGDKVRWVIGLIALGSLVMPLYLVIAPWVRGERGRGFLERVWRPALAGVLILVVALLMLFKPGIGSIGGIAVAIALVPLAVFIRNLLDWLNERYIITNRRVMEIKGIINKHVRDSALEKVNDVDLKQSVVGRVLGYGTVQIITGSDVGINMFRRISKPVRFKRAMLNAKEELHRATLSTPLDEPLAPAPPVPAVDPAVDPAVSELTPEATIPEMIEELAELHQKGIISEEEFQTKKTELLDRL